MTKMPGISRRVHYLADGHDRESAVLMDEKGRELTPSQAVRAFGGKTKPYIEVVSDSSRLETECLCARHPTWTESEVMKAHFLSQVGELNPSGGHLVAIHKEIDGSYHSHFALPGTEQDWPELEGAQGLAQKSWDQVWRKCQDVETRNWPVRKQIVPIQAELKTNKEEWKAKNEELREAAKSESADERMTLKSVALADQTVIETRRHELETQRLDLIYQSRHQRGGLEHMVDLKREDVRHGKAMARITQGEDGVARDRQTRKNRELFRHLNAEERKPLREAAVARELDVLNQRFAQDNQNVPEHLLKDRQAQQAILIQSVLLRHEAGTLRDQEHDWNRSGRREQRGLLLEGKDPVRDLVLRAQTIERAALVQEGIGRGRGGADPIAESRQRGKHVAELARLDERDTLRTLPPAIRDVHRDQSLEIRRAMIHEQHRLEKEVNAESPKNLEVITQREFAALTLAVTEDKITRIRDRESDLRKADLPAAKLYESLAAIQKQRHQYERAVLELRPQAWGRPKSDIEDREALQLKHLAEAEVLRLTRPVARAREREHDLGGHRRELAILLLQGKDLQVEAMEERHQAERELQKLRDPDGLEGLERRQEAQKADLVDRRALAGASGPEREAIRERLQERARQALLERQAEEKRDTPDALKDATDGRHQAERDALDARQRGERLRDKDRDIREKLDDRLESLEGLADRLAARTEAQAEREILVVERHQAEREALDARERTGQGVTPEDRTELEQRQTDERSILILEGRTAEIREREHDLGGHQRELAILLSEGKDLQAEIMAERHLAERELQQIRDPERLETLERRQEREKADLTDRRALAEASGPEREAIRERLQERARQALLERQAEEKKETPDALKDATEGRHQAERVALDARQRGERLRDQGRSIRETLDERLDDIEELAPADALARRLELRAEAQGNLEKNLVERQQAERETLEADLRLGRKVRETTEEMQDRHEREVKALAMDGEIDTLREKEWDAVGERPGRFEAAIQWLTTTSRFDEAEMIAEERRSKEVARTELSDPDTREKALLDLSELHSEERLVQEERRALDKADSAATKRPIREARLGRQMQRLGDREAQALATSDASLTETIRTKFGHERDSLKLNHDATLMRDHEQDSRKHMAPMLAMRLVQYKSMEQAMNRRHEVEQKYLMASGKAKGLAGADPKASAQLGKRQAQDVKALKDMRTSDLARTATRPLKQGARKAVALPGKAMQKLMKAQERATGKGKGHALKNEAKQLESGATGLLSTAGTAVAKTALTAVTQTAEVLAHQTKHIAEAVGVTAKAVAVGVVNPLAGAKEAGAGYSKVTAEASATAGKDLAKGGKATAKDAAAGAKDTSNQALGTVTSLGMNAMPPEFQAAVGVLKEGTKASVQAAMSLVRMDLMGAASSVGKGAVQMAGKASKSIKGDLGLAGKPLDLAAKIPVVGFLPGLIKLLGELSIGAGGVAGKGKDISLDR